MPSVNKFRIAAMRREKISQSIKALGLSLLCLAGSTQAAYYDTLPKGVRLLALRQVQTSSITGGFDPDGSKNTLAFDQSLSSKELSEIQGADIYFDELKNISPEAYDKFTTGAYSIDANAEVKVQGLGVAYGVTNRFTAYVAIPYYRADVNMKIKRTEKNNYEQVANLLNESGDPSDTAYFLNQLTEQLPDADGALLQTVLMRNYGYEPIGDWTAQGLGDIELVGLYRLTDWQQSGLATSFGVVLPTGRIKNPDMLQDIPFGDGQTDLFLEFGGGVSLLDTRLEIDSSLRYTHQFGSNKSLRIPQSSEMRFSDKKGNFEEKLGDKINYNISGLYKHKIWLNSILGYEFKSRADSSFESEYTEANQILAEDSHELSHTMKAGIKLTTIDLYKAGKFAAPISLEFIGRRVFSGENTPQMTRFDLEFRLYF